MTNNLLSTVITIPDGLLNDAPEPCPSLLPLNPEPANVVTSPLDRTILRITWLFLSATNKFPDVSSAKPYGTLNVACLPIPSKYVLLAFGIPPVTVAPPAIVRVFPVLAFTRRITLLKLSDTYMFPEVSIAHPMGVLNVDNRPEALLICPACPTIPARVDTLYGAGTPCAII